MAAQSVFSQLLGNIVLVVGACDEDLLSSVSAATPAPVIWLTPDAADATAAAAAFSQLVQTNRMILMAGDVRASLASLGPQLREQRVGLVVADQGGELAGQDGFSRDIAAAVAALTGHPPTTVVAVRQGEGAGDRLGRLAAGLAPQAGDESGWLVAGAHRAAKGEGGAFDMRLVDENEHLIPRPIGTLQTLNLDHLHRYAFAKSFCYNADVLDGAMGCGYSSLLLNCKSYTGIDIDANMVAFANQTYRPLVPNATYRQGSVLELPVPDKSIDTFISYETIEHLPPDQLGRYFAEAKRVVKPGGFFLCSTPIYRGDQYGLLTTYHSFEFRFGQFEASLLANGFFLQEVWYQWPPYFTLQKVMPSFDQTQQSSPVIVIAVCRVV